VRDVAMMAHMDKQTKETLDRVEGAVVRANSAREMSGITAPNGFWDPMGIAANIPEGRLLWFREAELKHGRVSMLACLGILAGEAYHPFFGGGSIPSTAVFSEAKLDVFWINLLLVAHLLEGKPLKAWKGLFNMEEGYVPGDIGWDPLGFQKMEPGFPGGFKEMQTRELNNGRLAMMGFMGMIAQELYTHKSIIEQLSSDGKGR